MENSPMTAAVLERWSSRYLEWAIYARWIPVLDPQLVAAGYQAVSMDVRGHGESSIQWPDYTVAGVGQDILALVQALNAGPAI